MSGKNYNFKVVLLGEGCVGKTSLMLRFINDQFNDKHMSTVQAAFMKKKIRIGNNSVELAIWDTAGQERYHALSPIYYRGSNGAFLVYDITDTDSFQRIKNWVKELKSALGNECVLCIVGNKSDLEKERHVSVQEAEEYASSVGANHLFASAKLNKGVTEIFLDISQKMIQKHETSSSPQNVSSNKRGGVRVADEPSVSAGEAKSSCC